MTDMAERGSDFIKDLGDAARRNPISAALIGMGIVWLFAGGKSGVGPGDLLQRTGLDRLPEAAKDTFNTARDGVASATSSAADTVRDAGNASIETATRMGSKYAKLLPDSANVLDNVRGNLTDLFKAQPLALGAIGLAIGAGIAAALPHTDIENSYLGETSEILKSRAAEIAGEHVDKATNLASDVVEAAADGARKEGLTMDGAMAAMDDLSGKLGRVVDAAGKSLSESVK
jgi:methyl-accepting chemotaxis protein